MDASVTDIPVPPKYGDRINLDKESIKRAFLDHLLFNQGKFPALATKQDYYLALAYTVRDRLLQRWISTASTYTKLGSRTVCYFSAEFLMGPHLGNNLLNLGIFEQVKDAVAEMGLDIDELIHQEEEPGLGNGGLGRLAACFLDSLATLEVPSVGYGIRYEFGIFHQEIVDGWQFEKTDKWLRFGNPWEIARPEWSVDVKFGGHTEEYIDERGRLRFRWIPKKVTRGIPYDTPILGYHCNTANTLRLWSSEAPESFDFSTFNKGDYFGAVQDKVKSENLTKVLYPNDENVRGQRLRLEQQHFFVSCSIQDMFRILEIQKIPVTEFHEKFTIQLNDTHPAIAVAELMRLLVDRYGIDWDQAWEITTKTFAYTNHTLMPEALEKWPVSMLENVLPRHMQIIYEINCRFLEEVRIRFFGDERIVSALSIIDESGERYVRMAHLACIASYAINGVAALHSELLKQDVLEDFHRLWPEKFNNKTNGVTPRRWLMLSNPRLSTLISHTIGNEWPKQLHELGRLESFVNDAAFREDWQKIKYLNKVDFARFAREATGIAIDPMSLYDVQVKRIHEYKRQHLNVLNIIALYLQIKSNPSLEIVPRTFIFGGKAAPAYHMAKLIIKLINSVAHVIEKDVIARDLIKVIFLPNYNVKNGQKVYPAAELSEQISTAGKEASGTGNMKFSMNGALTVGTLDGANIEIRDEVGEDNFFLFGLSVSEVNDMYRNGYNPADFINADPVLREVIRLLETGFFSRGDVKLFKPLVDNLKHHDPYLVLADFQSYVHCQQQIDEAYRDRNLWARKSILNTARTGKFSSDRSIQEYCDDIWAVDPVSVELVTPDQVKDGLLQ